MWLRAQSKMPIEPMHVSCAGPRVLQMCCKACSHQSERTWVNANISVDPDAPEEPSLARQNIYTMNNNFDCQPPHLPFLTICGHTHACAWPVPPLATKKPQNLSENDSWSSTSGLAEGACWDSCMSQFMGGWRQENWLYTNFKTCSSHCCIPECTIAQVFSHQLQAMVTSITWATQTSCTCSWNSYTTTQDKKKQGSQFSPTDMFTAR